MMVYTNSFSAILVFFICIAMGELGPSLEYCSLYPEAYVYFTARSVFIYLGVLCFATLMDVFDAVSATTVTTIRKVLSILFSFVLFPKPFTAVSPHRSRFTSTPYVLVVCVCVRCS